MTISLPDPPTEDDYEDLVVACLLASGHYVDTRVRYRDETQELLELDAVATPTGTNFENPVLVDAKSGKWGISDTFKFFGWRTFLGIGKALVVHPAPIAPEKSKAIANLSQTTGVEAIQLDHKDPPNKILPSCNSLSTEQQYKASSAIRYERIAERLALRDFESRCKSDKENTLLGDAREYEFAIESAFFEKLAMKRIKSLYDAFQASPLITGQLLKHHFAQDLTDTWNAIKNRDDHLWLQYVMLLENRARIAIIKNAVDHVLRSDAAHREVQIGKLKLERIS